MSLKLNGSTSGYVEIDAPAVAGSTSITLPTTTGGEFVVTDSAGDLNVDNGTLFVDASTNRVGIGTTSPAEAFTLGSGNAQITSGQLTVGVTSTSGLQFINDGTLGTLNSIPLILRTASTERMRITNTGEINTYSTSTGLVSSISAAAGTTVRIFSGQYGSSSTQTGTESFRVWSNGNVQNTNNSYGAISDAKLKENIVDAGSQWDDLKALQVRKYNFKEGQTHTQIGLIAQEVEQISPGLVTESPDRDAEGTDLGTVTKSVNYSVLYMKSVKALQEAMERIETLEAINASFEARLTTLEGGQP